MMRKMVFQPYTHRWVGILGAASILLGSGGLFVFVNILRSQTPIQDPLGYIVLATFGAGGTFFLLSGFKCLRLSVAMRHTLVRDEHSFHLLLPDGSTLPALKVRRTWVHPLPGGELWYFRVGQGWVILDCRLAEPEQANSAINR